MPKAPSSPGCTSSRTSRRLSANAACAHRTFFKQGQDCYGSLPSTVAYTFHEIQLLLFLNDCWPACEPIATTQTLLFFTVFHSHIFLHHIISEPKSNTSMLLLEIQQNMVPQAVHRVWWEREERRQRDFTWKATETLLKTQPLICKSSPWSSITCHTVTNSPDSCIRWPQWVPTEGTPGHPTVTLWDQWPLCDTPIPMPWLETKVSKIGETQSQGCGCWVASWSPRQRAYTPGIS